MLWKSPLVRAILAVSLLASPIFSNAADVNARIKGTVTDPAGAVVANAAVIATNSKTGVKFTTTSQADGGYLFPQLPIGTYDITASAPGFKTFSASGITLNIDQEYVEAVKLSLGSTSEQVSVEADAVQVNTTDMQLSNVVTSAQMVELPLIGRSFAALATTLPGVQAADNRFGTNSVSGAQSQQNSFLINGADSNDFALNTLAITPNLDAIDQFNLIDGPLNAEYDRNSGGVISATIKQGSNSFHGDAFEFYRDTFLNTNNFFQKSATGAFTPVSPYHQNIFGGTLGGPIWRDKLFFFAAYQGTRQSVPQGTGNVSVYSAANLSGDFSDDIAGSGPGMTTFSTNPIPSTISIPGCTTGETWAACLNPKNGVLPTTTFNSIATALTKQYVPAANSGTYGYVFNETTASTNDQYIGRIDFALNPKNQFTVLGIYSKGASTNTLPFTGATVPGFGDGSISHIQQWTFDYVRQLSSTAVNDLSAHYTRFNFNSGAPQQVVQPSSAGFSITPQDPTAATIPSLAVTGFFTLGGTTNGPQPRIDQAIQFDDNFSKTFGHHSLKFGYDGRRFNVSNLFDNSNSGAYSFNTTNSPYSTGDPSLDFLLGIPGSYSQGSGAPIQADAFLNYAYGQDTWKVSNTFTLNYGLGYSINTPLRNHQFNGLGVTCFIVGEQSKVFPGAPTNLVYPGDPGCTDSARAYTRHNNLGPRFGFAWAPDLGRISGDQGKFSIRGGFGIYYDRTEEESALQTLASPPFGTTNGGAADFNGVPQLANPFADINGGLTTGANGGPGQATEPNRFPYIPPVAGQAVDFTSLYPIYNIDSYDSNFQAPYAENFQLSIERELPSNMVGRLSYVGGLARHNQLTYEGNYETAAGQAACAADPKCIAARNTQSLAYPGHTIGGSPNIVEEGLTGSGASSSYNSFQASLLKGATHGLYFQLSYTYAHALDNGSSFENSGFGSNGARGYNQYNKSLNYGDSTFDARHRFVFAPVYTTPLLHGFGTFSPVNLALSGWQISGILTLATGQPYDISYAGTTSRSLYCSASLSFYACPDVPLQVAPLVKSNPRVRNAATGYSNYFSPASFAAEPIGTFGNIHRNPYHGPGINNTNFILAKNFNISSDGARRIQLRLESDDVFNHTNFANPSSQYGSATFGQITSINSNLTSRQTQLGAKVYF